MKKFNFSLDTVLSYKQQVLDALRAEHGAILAQVRRQEQVLEQTERHYSDLNTEFCDRKMTGLTVADAMGYEMSLRVLEQDIQREARKLEQLRQEESAKRAEVVTARQGTSSLEKLREKKLTAYNKDIQKSEEAFIDELVSAARVTAAAAAL